MADIEHSTITDPNIHEPKGIAAATADQIYVADGAGSGDWTDIDDYITAVNWTMNDLINVRYESNTSEVIEAETWTQRGLNQTKKNNLASASLSSNRISLPAGTYYIDASVPVALDVNPLALTVHKAKLYNVTGAADLVIGTVNTAFLSTASLVKGVFTLASTSNVEIRSWSSEDCESYYTGDLSSEGSAVSVGTEVVIWRIA